MFDEPFWRNAPKIYCDNAAMSVMQGTGDTFLMALLSGGNAQVFAFTPEHMKRVLQLLNHNMASYEKSHGEVTVEPWTPEMKSPYQVQDFKDGSGPRK